MDPDEREAQQRRHPRIMNKVRPSNIVFDLILIPVSSQASTGCVAREEHHPNPLVLSTTH